MQGYGVDDQTVDQTARDRVRELLSELKDEFGAQSCTLYVRDPLTSELRLIECPGVEYPEPLFCVALPNEEVQGLPPGLHIAESVVADLFANGNDSEALPKVIAEHTGKRQFLHLLSREDVARFVRCHLRQPSPDGSVSAVLYVNFSNVNFSNVKSKAIDPATDTFSSVFKDAVGECLEAVVEGFVGSAEHRTLFDSYYALDSRRLTKILRPLDELAGSKPSFQDGRDRLTSTLEAILHATLSVFDLTDATAFASAHLITSDKKHLCLAAETSAGVCSPTASVEVGEGIISWVFAKKQPIYIPDVATSRFSQGIYQAVKRPSVAELAAPMLIGRECIGVINVECSESGHRFTPAELELLMHAGRQAAIAYRLYKDSVMSSKVADLLDVTTRHVTGNGDVADALKQVSKKFAEWLGWDECAIYCFNPAKHEWEDSGATYETEGEPDIPREAGWSEVIREQQKPVYLAEIDDEGVAGQRKLWCAESAWIDCSTLKSVLPETVNRFYPVAKTQLGLPLMRNGEVIGAIWLKSLRHVSDVTIDLHIATALANQCSLVIESVQRFRRLQAFSNKRVEKQQCFFPTGALSLSGADAWVISEPYEGQIGGDFFRVVDLREGVGTGFVLGDTVGHGPMAAIDMIPLYAATRIFESAIESPSYFIRQLNGFALNMELSAEVIAFTVVRQNKRTWLVASSAGSLILYVAQKRRVSGKVRVDVVSFPSDDAAIGRDIGNDYLEDVPLPVEGRIELFPGDVIVAVTDGVPDAQGRTGGKFGDSGVQSVLLQSRNMTAEQIAQTIVSNAKRCAEGHPHDDLTVLALRIHPVDDEER